MWALKFFVFVLILAFALNKGLALKLRIVSSWNKNDGPTSGANVPIFYFSTSEICVDWIWYAPTA